jgi:predicted AAA+ superfamily ATPase
MQDQSSHTLVPRLLLEAIRPYYTSPEALVVTGMRRTGKTTLLSMIREELHYENTLSFDLESVLDRKLFAQENYDAVASQLRSMVPRPNERICVFLDEIQAMPNIPSVAKYLIDHHATKFFMSGSASYYLRNRFSESMAGRKYLFELFPFSFEEYLHAQGDELLLRLLAGENSAYRHNMLAPHFDTYLQWGGFPGVVFARTPEEKRRKLDDIFSSYYQLEIEQLSDFRKKHAVHDLITLLMRGVGSKLDASKLARDVGVSRLTVLDYLAFLKDTYLLHTVPAYSTSANVEVRAQHKFYLADTGLLRHMAHVSEGALFENTCYTLLRTRTNDIRYHQTRDGQEIDFIVDRTRAYECKLSAHEQDVCTLARRAGKLGINEQHVVSHSYSEHPQITYGYCM